MNIRLYDGKQNYEIKVKTDQSDGCAPLTFSPQNSLYVFFSGAVVFTSTGAACSVGSGFFPKKMDWTTPKAFPLISLAIACLSSSNSRSKFSLLAAMYDCSSLYNA